jgi:hypothetical protein
MGGSLEFHELLTKKKTIGEWRLEEELTPVIDKLVKTDALLKFMDSVLKYIEEETPRYKYSALRRIDNSISRIAISGILRAFSKYTNLEKAAMDALEYIVLSLLGDVLNMYGDLIETKNEEEKRKLEREIDGHAKTLVAYAKAYPDKTVWGLITFVDIVADKVKDVKEEVSTYGHPLM